MAEPETLYSLPPEVHLTGDQRNILIGAKEFAADFFSQARKAGWIKYGSHGSDHNFRVAGLAGAMATFEGQDPFLAILAGEIHDVGRAANDERAHGQLHGQMSVELAANFIDTLPLGREEKDMVLLAVGEHPFMAQKDLDILEIPVERRSRILLVTGETDILKVLQDADRLDGIGPITPVKVAAFGWDIPIYPDSTSDVPIAEQRDTCFSRMGRHREWFDMLWTESARKLGAPWVEQLDEYMRQFEAQMIWINGAYTNLGI